MKFLATGLVFLFSTYTFAAVPPQDCKEEIVRVGLTQIHQLSNREQTNCYITTSNMNNYVDLKYRDYLVSNDSLLVFVSIDDGPEDTSSGAKEFYFFPRNQRTSTFSISKDEREITIKGRYNFDFIFDSESSHLIGMTNAKVEVDPKISAENDGGVFITPTLGLVYELPFKLGGAPSADFRKTGVFKDAYQHECRVQIGKIFKYTNSEGETAVKYTDEQLKKVLAKLCPQIRY